MKRLLLIPLLMLMLLPAFSGEESFLSVSLGWSYDTNVFSSPLPTGYDPADDYPNGGKYIKRHNLSLGIDYDLYFTEESKVGLSWSAVFGLPLKVVTITPSLVDNELVHTYADETKNSMWSFCTGFGPVFRFSWDIFTLSLPIRCSIGTYDWFTTGIAIGLNISPSLRVGINDTIAISASLTYDAHLMKFLFGDSHVYDAGYIMLNMGASVGCVFSFGGSE